MSTEVLIRPKRRSGPKFICSALDINIGDQVFVIGTQTQTLSNSGLKLYTLLEATYSSKTILRSDDQLTIDVRMKIVMMRG